MSTSRLKRKLGDLGIDPNSAKSNESFCLIGTPLPPLEKSRDTGEFVPLWKQEVRDEKGRRRLHGAFTGGFSAGYFNTVGSKEGWTPSTFVSSRNGRSKKPAARPEDFMDEEDLAERHADLNLVDENEEMDLLGGTQAEMKRRAGMDEDDKDPITLALEQSILPAPSDSAGARILKKMGWRPGQGVGPRVTWRQRAIQDGRDPDAEVDDEAKRHMYAARDTPLLTVSRKDNYHGLGYVPGLSLNESLGGRAEGGLKGPKLSAGFGLGALNDAEDDDLDVYDNSSGRRNRHRLAYDASDAQDEHSLGSGAKHTVQESTGTPLRPLSSMNVFRDGSLPLAGFIVSDKPVSEDKWFPIPDIPQGWVPDPKRVWEKNKENVDTSQVKSLAPGQPQTHAQWKTGVSANERGAILGETPLVATPRSVFEYISQKDQERLRNIAGGLISGTSAEVAPESATTPISVPSTEPHVAQAALHGFQPFRTDPAKHTRYSAYLQSQAFPGKDDLQNLLVPLPGQTIEQFNKEMSEFAKSAALFRPVSGAMASRFTSAAVIEHGPKIVEGLHTPDIKDETSPEGEAGQKREETSEEHPRVHAARSGMYGPLTREVQPWQPARLLCKRFGVKDPNPEISTASSTNAASGSNSSWQPESEVAEPSSQTLVPESSASMTSGNRQGRRDLANIGLGDDEEQGKDILTYEKPSMDIFKAIFASDEEDSDTEREAEVKEEGKGDILPSEVVAAEVVSAATEAESCQPSSAGPAQQTEPIDFASFKPTFVRRADRDSARKSKDDKEKKEKREKKKNGKNVLVSFEVDDDGAESLSLSAPPKKHKDRDKHKKRKREEKQGDEDEGLWVERAPPEIVKTMVANNGENITRSTEVDMEVEAGPARGRKRAIDFM